MSATINSSLEIPWWKEPSREQWKAWIAAWLGWTNVPEGRLLTPFGPLLGN
jgi:hypothetical protein